jgi:hypothetical protein
MVRPKRAPLRSATQGGQADVGVRECGQRDEPRWAGDGWNDESVKVVEDSSGDQLGKSAHLAGVCATERAQVAVAVPLLDDRRRVSEPGKQKVEQQSPRPAIAVEEGVNPFELRVCGGKLLYQVTRTVSVDSADNIQPVLHSGSHKDV